MTVAERIAQIQAKAKAKGHDIERVKPRSVSACRSGTNRTGAVATADNARLPLEWHGLRSAVSNAEGYDDRREAERAVSRQQQRELSQLAEQVAKRLGGAWSYVSCDHELHNPDAILRHESGAGIRLSRQWDSRERFTASPVWPIGRSGQTYGPNRGNSCGRITFAESRTFASITSDIENRLITCGLFDTWAECEQRREEREANEDAALAKIQRLADALGGTVEDPRYWQSKSYPQARTDRGLGDYAKVALNYDNRISFEIETTSEELATAVCDLIRRHHDKKVPVETGD